MFANFQKRDTSILLVPKNGTQSIRTLVLKEHNDYISYDDIWLKKIHKYLSRRSLKNIIVITRNPYDRVVSCYLSKVIYHLQLPYFKNMVGYYTKTPESERITFQQYVNYFITTNPTKLDNHLRPQTLAVKKITNPNIHYFDIKSDKTNKLLKKLGFTHEIPIVSDDKRAETNLLKKFHTIEPVWNKNMDYFNGLVEKDIMCDYKCFYNADLLEKVYQYFKQDFETFGYDKIYT